MNSITDFVTQNGFEALLAEIEEVQSGEKEFHQVVEETSIELDDWFQFGWQMNEMFGRRFDMFAIPDFNYVRLEAFAEQYVKENNPLSYAELVSATADAVDSVSESDAAGYLEFAEYEEDGRDSIVDMSWNLE